MSPILYVILNSENKLVGAFVTREAAERYIYNRLKGEEWRIETVHLLEGGMARPEGVVRAKFYCHTLTNFAAPSVGQGTTCQRVELEPVTDYLDPYCDENKTFWTATPSGKIEMQLNNPNAFGKFEAGKQYYIDFVEVKGGDAKS